MRPSTPLNVLGVLAVEGGSDSELMSGQSSGDVFNFLRV